MDFTSKPVLLILPNEQYDPKDFLNTFLIDHYYYEVFYVDQSKDDKTNADNAWKKLVEMGGKVGIQLGVYISKKFLKWEKGKNDVEIEKHVRACCGDIFVNLHHHDEFSIRDGLGTVDDLIELLKNRNQRVCAITNHGAVGGWIKQYNRCKKAKIKSIFGFEGYLNNYRGDDPELKKQNRKSFHLVMLAKNVEGFYNLIKIHNDAQLNGFYFSPRTDYEHLKQWGKNVIGMSACLGGEISQALMKDDFDKAKQAYDFYKSVFDVFCIELVMIDMPEQIEMNHKLIEFAKKVKAPIVVTLDSHYTYPEHSETHGILLLIKTNKTEQDVMENSDSVWQFKGKDLYYKTEAQLRKLWEEKYKNDVFTEEVLNEAIRNTRRIANMCEDIELDSDYKLPKLYKDADAVLRNHALKGLREKRLHEIPRYADRVEDELRIIKKLGFSDYFLIVEKIVKDTKKKYGDWSVGFGRGCFVPTTRVIMADNMPQFINDIEKGDFVLSHDGTKQKVLETFEYEVDEKLIEIEIEDGRTIKCTPEHEIFIKTKDGIKTKKAKDLKEGDDIVEI